MGNIVTTIPGSTFTYANMSHAKPAEHGDDWNANATGFISGCGVQEYG
jgi:hypothetical protein